MCQDIFNVYKIHIVETDLSRGVLKFLGVYSDLKGQNLVKNNPKIPNLPPESNIQPGASILCRELFIDNLSWYIIEKDIDVVWPILSSMVIFRAKYLSKICKKMSILPPWVPSIQPGAVILCGDIPNDYLWSYDINLYASMRFNLFWGYGRAKDW